VTVSQLFFQSPLPCPVQFYLSDPFGSVCMFLCTIASCSAFSFSLFLSRLPRRHSPIHLSFLPGLNIHSFLEDFSSSINCRHSSGLHIIFPSTPTNRNLSRLPCLISRLRVTRRVPFIIVPHPTCTDNRKYALIAIPRVKFLLMLNQLFPAVKMTLLPSTQ
jgi:hypothetical protein